MDGSASADTGGGLTLEDIERELMADSDDEEAGETGGRRASAESGSNGQQQTSGLSEYELERLENIRRNKQVLRDLGLDEDPLGPRRPPPAPARQPRQPRAPDDPRRQSSRLQGASRPVYDDDAPPTTTGAVGPLLSAPAGCPARQTRLLPPAGGLSRFDLRVHDSSTTHEDERRGSDRPTRRPPLSL